MAAPRRVLIFIAVSVALFMASVDQTIVSTALPAIQHELHARITWAGWTITTYSLGQVIAMPIAGKLSDQFGRKTILLYGVALFTVASLCCGVAGSISLLIPLRGIQALGGGAFMPSASGIVADSFGPGRDRAVAMFTSIMPIGGIIGPILGGVFVTYSSWRAIFLVNLPMGVMLTALCVLVVPPSTPRDPSRLDAAGVTLLGATMLISMFGFAFLGSESRITPAMQFIGLELVSAALTVAFIRHIRRHATPFVPVRLLYGRGFGVMNLINFVYGGSVLGLSALVPLYAEQRYGLRPLQAGMLLTARAVGMVAVAGLSAMMLRRTGSRWPIAFGFTFLAAGLMLLYTAPWGGSAYGWLAMAAGVTGFGMGLAVPATNNATIQLAPDQIAAITGLRGMFRQSGSILTISFTTALLAQSDNAALTQSRIFLAFAPVMLALIPLLVLVPDHHGNW